MPHQISQSGNFGQLTTTSRRYPRYLSFSPGELEALESRLLGLSQSQSTANAGATAAVNAGASPGTLPTAVNGRSSDGRTGITRSNGSNDGNGNGRSGRSKLIKSHSCSVRYPDGREGCCHYTRGGPTWHMFRFDYVEKEEDTGSNREGITGDSSSISSTLVATPLPVQYETRRLENDVASIELACREQAAPAFRAAIAQECREYFRRAVETTFRKKHPERYQMKALRAKELAGKYAVCQPLGSVTGQPTRKRLLPVGPAYSRLEDANREWELLQGIKPFLVVACCNRLDRCWEIPRFNPLYAVFDPHNPHDLRKETPAILIAPATAVTSALRPHLDEDSGDSDDWDFLPGPDTNEDSEDDDEQDEEGDDAR